jgi:hypothetical protein
MAQVIPGPWERRMTPDEHETIKLLIGILDSFASQLKAIRETQEDQTQFLLDLINDAHDAQEFID